MKMCPLCHVLYPIKFVMCPEDGKTLELVKEIPDGAIIRGKYKVIKNLGQGAMGTVYQVRHMPFDEIRALKLVNRRFADDPQFLRRFQTEAIIMRRLEHPNAVRVYDVDETEDGLPFIVMEYVEGENLRQHLSNCGALPVVDALEIARQVCAALAAAHDIGVIHRDIKPENLLLAERPDATALVKVLDFGVAKVKDIVTKHGVGLATPTRTGMIIGTPRYVSPEQASGKSSELLDGRSDLYSLGVVLYEMLTGNPPFVEEDAMKLLAQHRQAPPQPPHLVAPDREISKEVSSLVMKALEKEPEDRFRSASDMEGALAETRRQEIQRISPTVLMEKPDPSEKPDTRRRREFTWTSLSIGVGVLVMVALAILLFLPEQQSDTVEPPQERGAMVSQPSKPSPEQESGISEVKQRSTSEQPEGGAGASRPVSEERTAGGQVPSPRRKTVGPAQVTRPTRRKDTEQVQRGEQKSTIRDHLMVALQQFDLGHYDAAIHSYQAALAIDPNNRTAQQELERARHAKQVESDVVGRRLSTVKINRLLDQAAAFLKEGKYEDAIKTYGEILNRDPNNTRAQVGMKRVQRAKAADERALRSRKKPNK